jgi:hypothetical protein
MSGIAADQIDSLRHHVDQVTGFVNHAGQHAR